MCGLQFVYVFPPCDKAHKEGLGTWRVNHGLGPTLGP